MVTEMLDAMEAPPARRLEKFTLDGQTVVLEDLLAWQPDLRPRILKLIRAGRLEIGPWYTMPDLWLPTPEALQQNLRRGRADCKKWGVTPRKFIYIPDSFGMPTGLPRLLREEGFNTVLFGRSQPPTLGNKAVDFRWCCPDGTNPVTALALPNSYFSAALLPAAREKKRLAAWLENLIAAHRHKSVPELIGAFAGVDHIRIQSDLPEIIATLRGLFPHYRFIQATLSEYAEAVIKKLPKHPPEHRGALRGTLNLAELHGTWSSRQDLKYEDHACSAWLSRAESLFAEATQAGHALLRAPLDEAWTLLLQNQAHDSICGCSPDLTAADQLARYRWIKQLTTDVIEEALHLLAGDQLSTHKGLIFSPPPQGSVLGLVEFAVDSSEVPAPLAAKQGILPAQLLSTQSIRRKDVRLAYTEHGPTNEVETDFYRHRWLAQLPNKQKLSFATMIRSAGFNFRNKQRAPRLNAAAITRLLQNLEIVRDVGGLYAHEPEGKTIHWRPRLRSGAWTERGPLRWSYRVKLTYPTVFWEKDAYGGGPASLSREIIIQLFPHLPVAIIEDTWNGDIDFSRVRLPLPGGDMRATIDRDEFDQVSSDTVKSLHEVPAAAESDRGFFFRTWLQVRAPRRDPLTFFGNGLHEFSLTDPKRATVAITFMRPQGFIRTSADWPCAGAQFHGSRHHRYALWFGKITAQQKRAFSDELAIPALAEATAPFEPPTLSGLGYATIQSRSAGTPVPDSPANWRPQPTHIGGWRRARGEIA